MLSPEDRQRIEEEERKRVAEEQYRAEVRSKLQSDPETPTRASSPVPWIIAVVAVLVGGFAWYNSTRVKNTSDAASPDVSSAHKASPVAKTRYVNQSDKIATGQIIIKARGFVQYRLEITPEMSNATVTGTFNASGGSGNDIEAVIADEMNYTNWINGHQAKVLWQTGGKETTGNISARLAPGTYYLVFSNKFSAFTDKQVSLEVNLDCQKAETYYE